MPSHLTPRTMAEGSEVVWGTKRIAYSVIVADQEKRWGSCSKGVVRLNWRIVQAPKRLVEYVTAHEVVHLIHEDHGRRFWATLGRLMPDYESRKVQLRERGGEMVW